MSRWALLGGGVQFIIHKCMRSLHRLVDGGSGGGSGAFAAIVVTTNSCAVQGRCGQAEGQRWLWKHQLPQDRARQDRNSVWHTVQGGCGHNKGL